MDIEKYKKSFAYEIQESKKNEMLKIFYDNAISKLPETSRGIVEVLVGVAYTE